jgi:hypothetical protein
MVSDNVRLLVALVIVPVMSTSALAVADRSKAAGDFTSVFQKNKPFFQEIVTETSQNMKVAGQNIVQKQSQTLVIKWAPKSRGKNGNWVIAHKIERVRISIEIAGNKITYDSDKNNNPNDALGKMFQHLVGAEVESTVGPNMAIRKVKGIAPIQKKLEQTAAGVAAFMGGLEDYFKQTLASALVPLPDKAGKKGDPWLVDIVREMPPIGISRSKTRYTYQGKQGTFDKIQVKITSILFQRPGGAKNAKLPFSIKMINLGGDSANGMILFDANKKRLDSADTVIKLDGKVTIAIGGMDTEVELAQTQRTKVKIMDKLPAKK